jgi:multicomponent Na+:H+ antiporter subunit G
MEIVATISLILSLIIFLSSAVGLWRFPDYYCRIHAVGMTDTAGIFFLIFALVLLAGDVVVAVKLIFLGIMIVVINPVVSHLIGHVGHDRNVPLVAKRKKRS